MSVSTMKISPIFYMGNKRRLISKGLIDLFPKNISTFYDVFAGSGAVGMNVNADKYVINDINENLINLYNFFRDYDSETIKNRIIELIDTYKLPLERTKRCLYKDKDKIEEYKQSFNKLKNHYNQCKDIFEFYTLILYSFSQIFRFNSKGEFNMPFGIDCYCYKNDIYIENGCNYFGRDNVCIQNKDFRELINIDNCLKNDFFYFDPPYINTTAVYNENEGWTDVDDKELYSVLNNLSDEGYRWALSSVVENKGARNVNLLKWLDNNNLKYYVYYFDNFAYTACGKGNAQTAEVVVTNYDFTKYMSNNNLNRKKLF